MTRWFRTTEGGKWHAMDRQETRDVDGLAGVCSVDTDDAAGSATGHHRLDSDDLCSKCMDALGLGADE